MHFVPLNSGVRYLIVEDNQVSQASFFLGKSMLAVFKHFCPHLCGYGFPKSSFLYWGTGVRLTIPYWASQLPFSNHR